MKRLRYASALSGAALLALSGCAGKEEANLPPPPSAAAQTNKKSGEPTAVPTVPPAAGTVPTNGMPVIAPGASANLTAEEALKKVPALLPQTAAQKKTMDETEAALKKSPDDPKVKTAYVEATYNYGHAVNTDGGKMPTILYRGALALFRRALKVDPKHQPSLDEKNLIEGIYTSMNRPVPQ